MDWWFDFRKQSHTVQPQTQHKLESPLAAQHIKQENQIKAQPAVKSEQEVKRESVKRERDEEMEEILASAYTKKAKTSVPIDLSDA